LFKQLIRYSLAETLQCWQGNYNRYIDAINNLNMKIDSVRTDVD